MTTTPAPDTLVWPGTKPETKTGRCWVLTLSNGTDFDNGDGVPHFPTRAIARGYATGCTGLGDNPRPRQLDRPCLTVACVCCEYVFDEDETGTGHFPDQDEIDKTLTGHEWTREGDGWECVVCSVGPCDRQADTHG